VARLSTPQYHYTAALDGLVPAATIAKFAASPTNQCRFNGKLYCLRKTSRRRYSGTTPR